MFPKSGPNGPFFIEGVVVGSCRAVTISAVGIVHTVLRIERE